MPLAALFKSFKKQMASIESPRAQCCCCAVGVFAALFGFFMLSAGICIVLNVNYMEVDTSGLPSDLHNEEGKRVVGIILIVVSICALGVSATVSIVYFTMCSRKPYRLQTASSDRTSSSTLSKTRGHETELPTKPLKGIAALSPADRVRLMERPKSRDSNKSGSGSNLRRLTPPTPSGEFPAVSKSRPSHLSSRSHKHQRVGKSKHVSRRSKLKTDIQTNTIIEEDMDASKSAADLKNLQRADTSSGSNMDFDIKQRAPPTILINAEPDTLHTVSSTTSSVEFFMETGESSTDPKASSILPLSSQLISETSFQATSNNSESNVSGFSQPSLPNAHHIAQIQDKSLLEGKSQGINEISKYEDSNGETNAFEHQRNNLSDKPTSYKNLSHLNETCLSESQDQFESISETSTPSDNQLQTTENRTFWSDTVESTVPGSSVTVIQVQSSVDNPSTQDASENSLGRDSVSSQTTLDHYRGFHVDGEGRIVDQENRSITSVLSTDDERDRQKLNHNMKQLLNDKSSVGIQPAQNASENSFGRDSVSPQTTLDHYRDFHVDGERRIVGQENPSITSVLSTDDERDRQELNHHIKEPVK